MEEERAANAAALEELLAEEAAVEVTVAGRVFLLRPTDGSGYLRHQRLLAKGLEGGEAAAATLSEVIALAVELATGLSEDQAGRLLRLAQARGEQGPLIDAAYQCVGMPPRGQADGAGPGGADEDAFGLPSGSDAGSAPS